MPRPSLRAAIAAALLAVAFVPAAAEEPAASSQSAPQSAATGEAPTRDGPGRAAMAACRGDMQTLCGSVERGGGRKIACLKENQAKLSPGCQAAITTVLSKYGAAPVPAAAPASAPVPAAAPATSAAAANVHQACHADIAAVCAGVDKSNGGIGKCLKDNAAKLSPGCQAAIADRKAKMQVLRQQATAACATDSQTLCGAGAKGHAALQCLREKESQLSAGCREVLASLPKPQHK